VQRPAVPPTLRQLSFNHLQQVKQPPPHLPPPPQPDPSSLRTKIHKKKLKLSSMELKPMTPSKAMAPRKTLNRKKKIRNLLIVLKKRNNLLIMMMMKS
jgi:hypothetical protein